MVKIVNFDNADSGRAIIAGQDCRVAGGSESRNNRRLQVICRRESGRLDLGLLAASILSRLPVIVYHESRITLMQLQNRIGQGARDPAERRAYAANNDALWVRSRNNEAGNKNLLAG